MAAFMVAAVVNEQFRTVDAVRRSVFDKLFPQPLLRMARASLHRGRSLPQKLFYERLGLVAQSGLVERQRRLGVHTHKSTPEVRLQKTLHYRVRDLEKNADCLLSGLSLVRL